MATAIDHTEIIYRRCDRTAALVRENRELLRRYTIDPDAAIRRIRAQGLRDTRDGLRAYAAVPYLHRLADELARLGHRLNGTRRDRDGATATVSGDSPVQRDGDNLVRMSHRILLDILADRDDDALFDVR